MQTQVKQLYNKIYDLIHLDDTGGMVCADDFTRLNKEIYELMNILWDRRGKTVDEEAQICLSLLMGFSVCMYTNLLGEKKRANVEERTEKVLETLNNLELKDELKAFYNSGLIE